MNAFPPIALFRSWIFRQSGTCAGPLVLPLAKRRTLGRRLAAGQALHCVRGAVWLTCDGKDIVLRAGERFMAGTKACLLIEALEDSVVRV